MSRYVWLFALLPGAALVDCRQVAGIADAPPEKLTTSISGLPYGTPSCAQCVNTSCRAESDACAGDPSCAAYQSCFGPCAGDAACWSQCIIDHPTTGAAVSQLSACMASRCEDACDLTCGGFAGRPFAPSTSAACQSCLAQKSCAQTRACAISPGCDQALRCINAAPTYDLVDSCELADGVNPSWGWNPDAGSGSALTQVFAAETSCGPPCAGTDWHCVGHVTWPGLSSVSVPYTLDLYVENYSTSGPESGVLVELCGFSDPNCVTSIAHGTTDPGGNVSLSFVMAQEAGASGLTGYLKLTRDDLRTSYLYWGFPLSGTELSTVAQVVTNSLNATLFQSAGVMPDPSRGDVAVVTYDCQFGFAPGVTVTIEPSDNETKVFDSNLQPTTTTGSKGLILFDNVPAGPVQVTATPPGLNRPSSTVPVTVRTDGETVVYAFPTP